MSEGRLAQTSTTYASAGASFLPWMSGSQIRLAEPTGTRLGAKLREQDEDTKSWAGFERRRHMATPPKNTSAMKGPAFWNKAATTPQRKVRARSIRVSWFRMPSADCCVCPCLRRVVYVLVAFALTLFFVMMSLISAYITKANNMDFFMQHLGGQQQRLKEAVKTLARGQRLHCVPCQRTWMQIADHCYLFTPERMSWKNCTDHCIAQQATLFIGHTEGEMFSLMLESRRRWIFRNQRLVHPRYWIGLMYNETAKTWLWADGAPLHIRVSAAEYSSPPNEDVCVQFHNGRQDTKKCTSQNHCLCKRKAP